MHRSLPGLITACTLSTAFLLVSAACNKQSNGSSAIAYVAPASLSLRRELSQKNGGVSLKHGERVEILEVRRRFVKVRTQKGEEGWVDSAQLLSPEQMQQIRRAAERALALPSEGSATVFEALNIHLDPNRQSPAFARIPEGGSVAVLAHRLAPKTAGTPRSSAWLSDHPQPLAHRQRKERQLATRSRLPSPPPPPKAPENWPELSSEKIEGTNSIAEAKANREKAAAQKKLADLQKPVILEDWSLVRTKNNQCGWVLSRNLIMSIPDEVAQYAEGKRITSYFDLGAVNDDEKGLKHNWLWTTASNVEPYDFDAWRVFLWNRRRHRYETSYRQRDVEGYFPVHVEPADSSASGRTFQLITKDDDGKFRRRTYFFDGTRVHLTGTEQYRPAESAPEATHGALNANNLPGKPPRESWIGRTWKSLKARVFGSG